MAVDLEIRDAQPKEREAIRDLTLGAYQEYQAVMSEMWLPYRDSIVETLADVTPAEQIVALHAGEIVGTVLLYPAGTILHLPDGSPFTLSFPEVRLLAVKTGARGLGVGRALTEECISRAARAGSPQLNLHTMDLMQSAMKMYERLGFVRTPETDFPVTPELVVKGFKFTLA